jgi:dihydrofolate reductase
VLAIIAAVAKNSALGKDNKLPWHLPSDLRRFKKITTGHTIIMGRKTYESLPGHLPNRRHIVLTRDPEYQVEHPEVVIVRSIPELLQMLDPAEEYFVIGGGEIYAQLLPYCDKMYLTLIDAEVEADTYFPEFNEQEWEAVDEELGIIDERNLLAHRFVTYKRRK